jgi:hypothetical protein
MVSGMPFKHNAARRHRIPKTRYRVQNWPAYEGGLKRCIRSLPAQQSETVTAVEVLNQMIRIAKPTFVRIT